MAACSISTPPAASSSVTARTSTSSLTPFTEVGELLYRLEHHNDVSALAEIGTIAEKFIRFWRIKSDVIGPAPRTVI